MPIASIRNRDSQQALAYIPLLPVPSPLQKKGSFRETKQNRSRNGEATDFLTEIPSHGPSGPANLLYPCYFAKPFNMFDDRYEASFL
jgi:hypothetical protein